MDVAQQRVRTLFEQAVASGLSPNEAAAQAIRVAQEEAVAAEVEAAQERRVAGGEGGRLEGAFFFLLFQPFLLPSTSLSPMKTLSPECFCGGFAC